MISPPTIDSKRRWYVVYSKPHKENIAKFHISAKGVEVFFPRLCLPKNTKKMKSVVPLFPNYLFVHLNIESEEFAYVSWSPGVNRIVGFNDCPASVDDEVLGFLQSKADSEGIIAAESSLKRGQEVQIINGPFGGLSGIIREPPNAKGRVKVLLTLLNREASVEIPVHSVEASWIAADLWSESSKT